MIDQTQHLPELIAFHQLPSEQGIRFGLNGETQVSLSLGETVREAALVLTGDRRYPLRHADDALWTGTFQLPEGFQYAWLEVDGIRLLSPHMPICFGYGEPTHYLDVPAADDAFYQIHDVPHGTVSQHIFRSSVSGKAEDCVVYMPPEVKQDQLLPVLYLQHGHGENETGWCHQGRLGLIMDNLLAERHVQPMLVVMGNGMTVRNGAFDPNAYPEVLVQDLIPFIEARYPVLRDKWHRAMAGLSMGSMQTSITVMTHPELFGYAGLFSGFLRHLWQEDQPHLAMLDDADAFASAFRLFFRAIGKDDEYRHLFEEDNGILASKHIQGVDTRYYDGAHEWQVWRHCLKDFLPLLFRD